MCVLNFKCFSIYILPRNWIIYYKHCLGFSLMKIRSKLSNILRCYVLFSLQLADLLFQLLLLQVKQWLCFSPKFVCTLLASRLKVFDVCVPQVLYEYKLKVVFPISHQRLFNNLLERDNSYYKIPWRAKCSLFV